MEKVSLKLEGKCRDCANYLYQSKWCCKLSENALPEDSWPCFEKKSKYHKPEKKSYSFDRYLAKDKDGSLWLYNKEPILDIKKMLFIVESLDDMIDLCNVITIPEIKCQDQKAIKCKITIEFEI